MSLLSNQKRGRAGQAPTCPMDRDTRLLSPRLGKGQPLPGPGFATPCPRHVPAGTTVFCLHSAPLSQALPAAACPHCTEPPSPAAAACPLLARLFTDTQ